MLENVCFQTKSNISLTCHFKNTNNKSNGKNIKTGN